MAKIKPIYLIGAAALAAYFFRDKLFGAKAMPEEAENVPESAADKKPDVTIDASAGGGKVQQAIEQAKAIAQGAKDIAVMIKTPSGQANIELRKGKKRKKKKHTKKHKVKKTQVPYASEPISSQPYTFSDYTKPIY